MESGIRLGQAGVQGTCAACQVQWCWKSWSMHAPGAPPSWQSSLGVHSHATPTTLQSLCRMAVASPCALNGELPCWHDCCS